MVADAILSESELKLIGGMTAPVAAFGSEPTWMALVEKPVEAACASAWPLLWPFVVPLVLRCHCAWRLLGTEKQSKGLMVVGKGKVTSNRTADVGCATTASQLGLLHQNLVMKTSC